MIQHYIYANVDNEKDIVSIGASTLDGKTEVPVKEVKEALAAYSLISWRLGLVAGKVLTQADASFADPVQRKAFKDCIRNIIADEYAFFADHMQRGPIETSLKDIEDMSEEEFLRWQKDHPPVDISEVIAPDK